MNRTHWAVKEEDLFGRLHAENLIEQEEFEPSETPEDIENIPDSKVQ